MEDKIITFTNAIATATQFIEEIAEKGKQDEFIYQGCLEELRNDLEKSRRYLWALIDGEENEENEKERIAQNVTITIKISA